MIFGATKWPELALKMFLSILSTFLMERALKCTSLPSLCYQVNNPFKHTVCTLFTESNYLIFLSSGSQANQREVRVGVGEGQRGSSGCAPGGGGAECRETSCVKIQCLRSNIYRRQRLISYDNDTISD